MPFFQYECKHCGALTDLIRTYTDRKRGATCRECEIGRLEFVDKIQPSSFKLKGQGWYETDFKHKS